MSADLNNPNVERVFATEAPKYWARGLSVLPLEPKSKRPAKEINGWPGYVNGPPSIETQRDWLRRFPDRGIGLLTGSPLPNDQRLMAADVDQEIFLPVTRLILGRKHVEKKGFRAGTLLALGSEDIKSTALLDFDRIGAIDILAGGKQTVLPPSIHPDTGLPYRWTGPGLLDIEFPDLPVLTKRKVDLLRAIVGSEHVKALAAGATTHDPGLAFTAQLVQLGCEDEQIKAVVRAVLPENYGGNSLEELPGWISSARKKGFDQPSSGKSNGPKKPNPVEQMLKHVDEAGFSFFHDEEKRGLMTLRRDGAGTLSYLLGSGPANSVLSHVAYKSFGVALREAQLKDITAAFRAQAIHDGPIEKVFTRLAREGDAIFVDRGAEDGSVVRISPNGFELLPDSPVKFVRSTGMLELPIPRLGGDLNPLKALLGHSDETFTLLLAFILNCLRAEGPFMCLLVEGEQGSGKSSLTATLRQIIDPNMAGSIRLPDNERELMVLANELFLLTFDNSSGMRANISDLLCSLSTRAGYITRKLYSDGDLHIMRAVRPFIINGISDFATRADLVERSIPIQLERPQTRKTENEILEQLRLMLPDVLGALYRMVACALSNENSVTKPTNIRMADTALWLKAAEPATGLPEGAFLETLERSQVQRMIERTNGEPVVIALRLLLAREPFVGTVGDLLAEITPPDRRPRFFPETALKLSKDLNRMKTGMALAGIHFEREARGNRGQMVRVWLEGQENLPGRGPEF